MTRAARLRATGAHAIVRPARRIAKGQKKRSEGTIRTTMISTAGTGRSTRTGASTMTMCARAFALALGLALAGCQSAGVEALEDVAAGPAMAAETLGGGEAGIALLLPRSAGGATGRQARDIRDAAALALDDLGAGKLAVTIHDVGAGSSAIGSLGEQLATAKLVLGPVGSQAIAALAAVPSRPPALAFGSNGDPHGGGVFALQTDAVDSALESARVSIGAGHKIFAAIVPQSFSQAERTRLAAGLQASGVAAPDIVAYGDGRLAADLAAARDRLVKADAVIVFGAGATPASIASALRKTASLGPRTVLIGNMAYAAENFSRPELDGMLIAMPDQTTLAMVGNRYQAKTGRPLSLHAAYGYDAVAVAAGIVRALGPDALTQATLTKPSGFRGSTGVFRFRQDGKVERQLALYRIRNASLELLDAPPEGF